MGVFLFHVFGEEHGFGPLRESAGNVHEVACDLERTVACGSGANLCRWE